MKRFANTDVENYYDQTEVHYRMHWKLGETFGLHYGIWDDDTKNLKDALLNTNHRLMILGDMKPTDIGVDAGCGIGGSSIYLARQIGCKMEAITLSKKQAETGNGIAKELGLSDKVNLSQQDYTATNFADNTFDFAWSMESMQTAFDKDLYFKEMSRIVKPGGKILIADFFKPEPFDIDNEPDLQVMLNGWAMSDIISVPELKEIAERNSVIIDKQVDATKQVKRSVNRLYYAGLVGKLPSILYNMMYNASYFSKTHYKTAIAQKKAYDQKKWVYYFTSFINNK